MKNIFWTWRKVVIFLTIIGLGIIGIIIADQHDFVTGRNDSQTAIGNGVADPLVSGKAETSSSTSTQLRPIQKSGVDGVKKVPCVKGC